MVRLVTCSIRNSADELDSFLGKALRIATHKKSGVDHIWTKHLKHFVFSLCSVTVTKTKIEENNCGYLRTA